MAGTSTPEKVFHIEEKLKDVAPHHKSFQDLWETKWKKPATMGVYPFMFGTTADFEPVVDDLIKRNFHEPYNWDDYASAFIPHGDKLVNIADEALAEGNKEKASEYYLRASAIYRIARFPAPRSPVQKQTWELGKKAAGKGLALRAYPVQEVSIFHSHRIDGEGKTIEAYYMHPSGSNAWPEMRAEPRTKVDDNCPLLIILTGLDGYRTELAVWMEGWRRNGVATLVFEIPGTGDSPADPRDPKSPDRMFNSVFDWIAMQSDVDQTRVGLWAFSTGGFYAIRVAHTHAEKLAGAIALGGGCHHMFEEKWLDNVDHLEYPFDLAETLAWKWGYGEDVDLFKKEAKGRFSLLEDGTLAQKECTRLLLVNGTEDEIFPIDDYYLALHHGAPKEARFIEDAKHMGEPESFLVCLVWLYKLFGIQADPVAQLSTLPFKPKY